jgi:hypothetical protein
VKKKSIKGISVIGSGLEFISIKALPIELVAVIFQKLGIDL